MTAAGIVVILIKCAIVLAFLLTMAAVSVWADRRVGGLAQDRIGPMRAVLFLPRMLVQLGMVGGAAAVAFVVAVAVPWLGPGAAAGPAFREYALGRMTVSAELAVFVCWFGLLFLAAHVRRSEPVNAFEEAIAPFDPRTFFYGGVVAHLVVFPLVRLVPAAHYGIAATVLDALVGVLLMGAAAYTGFRLPEGKVGIRIIGLLTPVADAIKMIIKEDLRPQKADRLLFALGPVLAMFPALVTFAVIPFGSTLCFQDANSDGALNFGDLLHLTDTVGRSGACAVGDLAVPLQVADLNVGLLYIFAIGGTGIIGAALAGWASDSKFALLGGLRATAQMVSYEVALGPSIVGLLLVYGTVHMQEAVDWQGAHTWGIFVQPLGFLLYLAALIAETKRVPFDQPEGESEIVAGYHLEYSGLKFGMFFLGEYIEFAFASALLVTLFFGGYHLPFVHAGGIDVAFAGHSIYSVQLSHLVVSIIHVAVFFSKVLLVAWLHVFIRWTLPRLRYDQVMKLGWKGLLPACLVNILLTAVIVMAIHHASDGVHETLQLVADVTQAVLALGGLVGAVALVSWLLEPGRRQRFLKNSSARYAAAAGGAKMGPTTP